MGEFFYEKAKRPFGLLPILCMQRHAKADGCEDREDGFGVGLFFLDYSPRPIALKTAPVKAPTLMPEAHARARILGGRPWVWSSP